MGVVAVEAAPALFVAVANVGIRPPAAPAIVGLARDRAPVGDTAPLGLERDERPPAVEQHLFQTALLPNQRDHVAEHG